MAFKSSRTRNAGISVQQLTHACVRQASTPLCQFCASMLQLASCWCLGRTCSRYCLTCSQGEFKSIMAIVTSCRSDMSPQGLSRNAHLADGRMHLVLVRKCSILQYLKFLSLIPTCGRRPLAPQATHVMADAGQSKVRQVTLGLVSVRLENGKLCLGSCSLTAASGLRVELYVLRFAEKFQDLWAHSLV